MIGDVIGDEEVAQIDERQRHREETREIQNPRGDRRFARRANAETLHQNACEKRDGSKSEQVIPNDDEITLRTGDEPYVEIKSSAP
jgi:hypothetical protein